MNSKDSDGGRKQFIFKLKNLDKNTNTENKESTADVSLRGDESLFKSHTPHSEEFVFDSKESFLGDGTRRNNDRIKPFVLRLRHFEENADTENKNSTADMLSEDISEAEEQKPDKEKSESDSEENLSEENASDNGSIIEEYEEIYSYSDRSNISYLEDKDVSDDVRVIIEGIDINQDSDISEDDVNAILEVADTRFDTGDNFEEEVRQVFRSMRAEGDTDEEDVKSILDSVSVGEETENKTGYGVIDINEDLDALLADIHMHREENKEYISQKGISQPSKREKLNNDSKDNLTLQKKIDSDETVETLKKKRNNRNEKKGNNTITWELIRRMIFSLITVAALTVLLTMLFMPVLQIYGTSMSPLLEEGDILLTFRTSDFEKGDIISFYYNNKILVKRVIAFEGDYIYIENDGSVYVNNKRLEENYISEKAKGECDITLPYQVPSGKIFVLGDHRLTSIDSRNKAMGCVSLEQISGKPVFRIWPLNRIGFVEN